MRTLRPKKNLIEKAYTKAEGLGLDVWCEDEAGPFQTRPQPGEKWCPCGKPDRYDSEFMRQGTAKVLTLFHPRDGTVLVKGVSSSANAVLHPWLEEALTQALSRLPPKEPQLSAEAERALWEAWQENMQERFTLPSNPVPLRLLLVLENLTGHKSHRMILWFYAHGVMPLFTPLGGSWLNMAESIQRILKRRGLSGHSPLEPEDIMRWFEEVAAGWNRNPTPFIWNGKRQERRQRARQRNLHRLGGSGACVMTPVGGRERLAQIGPSQRN